jgi:dUTP pyrophosphatase
MGTSVKIALPAGYEAQIRPRSGLAARLGLTVLNTPGTIDAGYRGEICVILYNTSRDAIAIRRGMKIAQMVVHKLPDVELDWVPHIDDDTDRGAKGFGSSG